MTNIAEVISVITKGMSEEGVELTNVELYEEAVELNNKVKVKISNGGYLINRASELGAVSLSTERFMVNKVLGLLKEDDWLPGDDIEAYGEWFTLVVEESSHCTPDMLEKHTNIHYRLLNDNYSLSERMTLEDLKNNYTNASLEQGRLK